MRAVMVMFDTLNRRYLPAYGGSDELPNFVRLAEHSVTFDRCYAGSMPCMPARREMHTGRHNFLHRSWGPLEPFDDSVPAMLKGAGVYSHLVTDHKHYWGDGGATYHGRYNSFEFFRGQEGDAWKGHVRDPDPHVGAPGRRDGLWRQDQVNRAYTARESDHPQTLTFDAGLEFIVHNQEEDSWFLQIEAFDPHEPFTASERFQNPVQPGVANPDWPMYRRAVQDDPSAPGLLQSYRDLLRQCDESLGRVLDLFDGLNLWDDTLLIVCTDHGLLLGEHEWWGKMVQPWYEENIHVPLFVWDPRSGGAGERNSDLVQTIDLGPTLLEFFGVQLAPDMAGHPIGAILSEQASGHDVALFGNHGGHVSVTDGRYVYMRSSVSPENQPLNEYTLMPTHLHGPFQAHELASAELEPPMPFTKGIPLLRVPAASAGSPWIFGTLLFDLENDPGQRNAIEDDELEMRMAEVLVRAMRSNDAPPEQFTRLGLPARGPVEARHLLVRSQSEQRRRGELSVPDASAFEAGDPVVSGSVRQFLDRPETRAVVVETMPFLLGPFVEVVAAPMTLVEACALGAAVGMNEMVALNDRLKQLA